MIRSDILGIIGTGLAVTAVNMAWNALGQQEPAVGQKPVQEAAPAARVQGALEQAQIQERQEVAPREINAERLNQCNKPYDAWRIVDLAKGVFYAENAREGSEDEIRALQNDISDLFIRAKRVGVPATNFGYIGGGSQGYEPTDPASTEEAKRILTQVHHL